MSSTPTLDDVAALRAAVADVGARLTEHAAELPVDDLFELVGALQGLVNAAEGAQLVAVAHAASHETRLTDRGPVEVHHGLGFRRRDGTHRGLAGHGGRAVGRRSPRRRWPPPLASGSRGCSSAVIEGGIGASTAQKVVATCDGLDAEACATVEALLAPPARDLDPSRVTALTRRIATRVAADQVREAQRKNRRDRCVQVSPGPDGTTQWWAQLPTDRSAAAWAADPRPGRAVRRGRPVTDHRPGQGRRVPRPAAHQRHRHRQGHPRHPRHHHRPGRRARRRTHRPARPAGHGWLAPPRAVPSRSPRARPTPWEVRGSGRGSPSAPRSTGASCRASAGSTPTPSRSCSTPSPSRSDGPCSTPAPAPSSRPPAAPTGRPRTCARSSPPATAPAGCGAATAPRPPATSTTPDPGRPGPPRRATSPGSADATTASSSAAAGPTGSTPTAPSPGPRPAGGDAPPCPSTPPGHHRTRRSRHPARSPSRREPALAGPPPF